MSDKTKVDYEAHIAARLNGKELSQEQVASITARVMDRVAEATPIEVAAPPVEPKFAGTLFQEFNVGSSLKNDGVVTSLANARQTQDYNKTWDARLNQNTYSSEKLQTETQRPAQTIKQVSLTSEQMAAEYGKKK